MSILFAEHPPLLRRVGQLLLLARATFSFAHTASAADTDLLNLSYDVSKRLIKDVCTAHH